MQIFSVSTARLSWTHHSDDVGSLADALHYREKAKLILNHYVLGTHSSRGRGRYVRKTRVTQTPDNRRLFYTTAKRLVFHCERVTARPVLGPSTGERDNEPHLVAAASLSANSFFKSLFSSTRNSRNFKRRTLLTPSRPQNHKLCGLDGKFFDSSNVAATSYAQKDTARTLERLKVSHDFRRIFE